MVYYVPIFSLAGSKNALGLATIYLHTVGFALTTLTLSNMSFGVIKLSSPHTNFDDDDDDDDDVVDVDVDVDIDDVDDDSVLNTFNASLTPND